MTHPAPPLSVSPLDHLARLRTIGARESATVLALGKEVLLEDAAPGEEEWAVREQVAIAALDVGDIEFAETQLAILSSRFPASPRLEILRGMRAEAAGDYTAARAVYEALLAADECNVSAHQRLIALALYSTPTSASGAGSTPALPSSAAMTRTVPLLVRYLTTFHTDPAAWGLLADLYLALSGYPGGLVAHTAGRAASVAGEQGAGEGEGPFGWWLAQPRGGGGKALVHDRGKYLGQARTALGQRLLLEPFNWAVMARFGEVALMDGEPALAYRTFLRAVEMATDPDGRPAESGKKDPPTTTAAGSVEAVLRASDPLTQIWWWIEICLLELDARARTLTQEGAGTDADDPAAPEHATAIRALARDRICAGVGESAGEQALRELEALVRARGRG